MASKRIIHTMKEIMQSYIKAEGIHLATHNFNIMYTVTHTDTNKNNNRSLSQDRYSMWGC